MTDRKKRQEDNRKIMRTFTLVLQLGITMLTSMFLCVFLGSLLVRMIGWTWIFPLCMVVGALAGIRSCMMIIGRVAGTGFRRSGEGFEDRSHEKQQKRDERDL